ncbi:hypothetical protein A2U01_0066118, partial [Trifolium medium]|nr:hypothetical protein [Trifolium medium]
PARCAALPCAQRRNQKFPALTEQLCAQRRSPLRAAQLTEENRTTTTLLRAAQVTPARCAATRSKTNNT